MPTPASYSCYFYYCVDHSFIFYILLSVQIITPVIAPVFNGIRGQAQLQMHQHINAKNCINGKYDKCILCTRCKGIGLKYILGNQNPRKWEVSSFPQKVVGQIRIIELDKELSTLLLFLQYCSGVLVVWLCDISSQPNNNYPALCIYMLPLMLITDNNQGYKVFIIFIKVSILSHYMIRLYKKHLIITISKVVDAE